MSALSGAAAPRTDDGEAIVALAELLEARGYTAKGIQDTLEAGRPFKREPSELPYHVRRLPEGEPLTALVKLFLLDLPVSEAEAAAALAPLSLGRLRSLGVLRTEDGRVEALLDVVPHTELVVASDRWTGEGMPERRDHVYGFTPPGRTLVSLTARRPCVNALDLGSGCGLQALLAAGHAEHALGIDLNPRAVAFARFNAVLNGLDNVEFREGDMLEPVEGGPFDLVVCNPPYLISPQAGSGYLFRDTDVRGDLFCEQLIGHVPSLLSEGGLAHVLVSWPHPAEGDWSAPLRSWVGGSGCDALLIRYATFTPLMHAAEWNRSLRPDPDAYAEALDQWLAFYREEGIEAIGWGAIVLRRRSGGVNWVWAESPLGDRQDPQGHHVLRMLANCDLLAALGSEAELLNTPLVLAGDHVLEREFHFDRSTAIVDRAFLRLTGGFRFSLPVDRETVEVLARLDGSRTVAEAVTEAGIDDETGVRAAAEGIRRLLELGFVTRA